MTFEPLETRALLASPVDLGSIVNGNVFGINNSSDVIYFIDNGGAYTSYLQYSNGTKITLSPLAGDDFALAHGINDSDQLAGDSGPGFPDNTGFKNHAFLYANGMKDIGTLPGFSASIAYAINDNGEVVGGSYPPNAPDVTASHAFSYTTSGGIIDLGTLGGKYSAAYAINDAGVIVGESDPVGGGYDKPFDAFLYTPGVGMTDLGTLPGYESSVADGINASGQVVGELHTTEPAFSNDKAHAFLDSGGVMRDLGTLGGDDSYATAINRSGQVVGYSSVNKNENFLTDAFLYSNGVMTDLNTLLPANSGWVLETATDINDLGVIVGVGTLNGRFDGYELSISSTGGGTGPGQGSTGGSVTLLQTTDANPVFGQSVTLMASVGPAAGANGTPDGSVTFEDASTTLGTEQLIDGSAMLTLTTIPVGNHAISASYNGNTQFYASASTSLDLTVQKDGTTVGLVSSTATSSAGQPVEFTAVVTPLTPGGGAPTGTITFADGGKTLSIAPLIDGKAMFSFSGLSLGRRSITASYSGDSDFQASNSPTRIEAITPMMYSTKTRLKTSARSAIAGKPITLTVIVTPNGRITATPTGTVSFEDGGIFFKSVQLRKGRATITVSKLVVGTYPIEVDYDGDQHFNPSTSNPVTETIKPRKKTKTVSSRKSPAHV